MQIRRNTKAFKTILEIFSVCQSKADRQALIRLYITRAGHSIQNKISVQGTKGEAEFFYDLSYQAVVNNLTSPNHQLHQSEDTPGVYFFRNNLSMDWDETPFEFDPAILQAFATLPELPTTRKKDKSDEFVMPGPETKTPVKKEKATKPIPPKAIMYVDQGPPPPDYKLKNKITWTELDKVLYRPAKLSKRDLLDFYNQIAPYLLPYLKDRPLLLRKQSENGPSLPVKNLGELPKKYLRETPTWMQQVKDIEGDDRILCNDKDHLLLCVEHECIEFDHSLSKRANPESPDFLLLDLDSASNFDRVVEAAVTIKEILHGLRLPSFPKTDGKAGLQIYIPLEGNSSFETSYEVALFICKLIRLKIPSEVAIKGSDDASYGKVILDPSFNRPTAATVSPYSLVAGYSPTVATPVEWAELENGVKSEEFDYKSIFDRLKTHGDLFEKLARKKASADEVLASLQMHYAFLLPN